VSVHFRRRRSANSIVVGVLLAFDGRKPSFRYRPMLLKNLLKQRLAADSVLVDFAETVLMMGEGTRVQGALFYGFDLERYLPTGHLQ
jgi:hypothetical protein